MKFHTWTCAHCATQIVAPVRAELDNEVLWHLNAICPVINPEEAPNADVG